MGGRGQRLDSRCIRSSFAVVDLHDSWSNYPRSIWHVITAVHVKWGQPGNNPKFWEPWSLCSRRIAQFRNFPWEKFVRSKTSMSVLLNVGPKCTLAASHAAPWWVTVSMPAGETYRRTEGRYITFSARRSQRHNAITTWIWCRLD